MKIEELDDAVRRKLENADQPFTEGDLKKVFAHVQKRRRLPKKGLGGSWMLYALSAAAFVGITTWGIHRAAQKNGVSQKTDQHQILISSENPLTPLAGADTVHINHENITKVPKTVANVAHSVSEAMPAATQLTPPAFPQKIAPENINAVNSNIPQQEALRIATEPSETMQVEQIPLSKTGESAVVKNMIENDKINPGKPETEKEVAEEAQNMSQNEEQSRISTSKPDTITQPASSSLSEPTPGNSHKITFSAISLGVAPVFRYSNLLTGAGIAVDALWNNHFGISTGLTYNFLRPEKFADGVEFYKHHDHGNNNRIDTFLMNKPHVRQITVNSKLVQLPVNVYYNQPLPRNWSMQLGGGTVFDLRLRQNVQVDRGPDSSQMDRQTLNTSSDAVALNNMLINIGVQKQWNRFAISLSPYIGFKLKGVYYKPKDQEVGIDARISYFFGK